MPFGPYKDLAACVAAHGDKKDPAAYCATIERAITKRIGITKTDDAQQRVFGWSTVSEQGGVPLEDLQGDVIEPEVLEDAVYDFLLHSRESGEMHVGVGKGHIIESVVFTPEKLQAMGLDVEPFTKHWIGVQFEDREVYQKCRSGEYQGFSIQGTGVRVPA